MSDEKDVSRLTPDEQGMVLSGRLHGSPVGVVEVVEHLVRERMAQAWDEALTHVWALNDPAYTILTDTESIHPLLTRNDVEQGRRENPYRVIPPGKGRDS